VKQKNHVLVLTPNLLKKPQLFDFQADFGKSFSVLD